MSAKYLIGVDPGSITGIAIYQKKTKELVLLQFTGHCKALFHVYHFIQENGAESIKMRIEDARLMKGNAFFSAKNGSKKDQGVGYVKAYSKDWEIFCKQHKVEFELLAPNSAITKSTPEYFKMVTGIDTKKTESHLRDAGLLVWNR